MAVFRNRPFAAACCLLILSVAAAYLLPSTVVLCAVLAVSAIFLVLCLSFLWRPLGKWRMLLILLTLAVSLGGGRALLSIYQRDLPLEKHVGENVSAELTVSEVKYSNTYSSTVLVQVHAINGAPASGMAMLISPYATPFYEGDRFTGSFTAQALGYDEYYRDSEFTYRAEGCSILLLSNSAADVALLESGTGGLATALRRLQLTLSRSLTELVEGEEGKLLSALLLGTRKALGEDTIRNFRRVGISHLLALSGLHLGILAWILDRFLLGLGARKRLRIAVVFFMLLGYLLLTGCSFSMLRAILMLGIVYLAFLLREDADALTALLTAGAAIVLVTPYAIFSLSYQMTMLATFGILAFERIQTLLRQLLPKKKGKKGLLIAMLRGLLGSLLLSFSASVAVLPVQWLVFGECSLMSPLANLLFIPLATPLLVLGLLALFAFPSQLFAAMAKVLASLLLWGVELLARTDCMVSLRFDFVPYLLLPFFLLILILLLIDLKKRLWLMPAALGSFLLSFAIAFTLHSLVASGEVEFIYRAKGKNEGLLFCGTQGAVICDVSNGSATQLRQDWALLQEAGATELDVLLLTHYHKEHAIALRRFGKSVYIKELWAPQPVTETDFEVLEELKALCETLHIAVSVYRFDEPLTLFETGEMTVSVPLYESRSTQPTIDLRFSYADRDLRYVSASLSEYLRHDGAPAPELCTDLYILGAHGPVPHETISFVYAGEKSATVLVANEEILRLLEINGACRYIYAPSEHHLYFKD